MDHHDFHPYHKEQIKKKYVLGIEGSANKIGIGIFFVN